MRATSLRVEAGVKEEFDRLRTETVDETGQGGSASDLLARLVRFARRHEAEWFREDAGARGPPDRDQIRRLLARTREVRVRTRVRALDRDLYGARP